MLAYTFQRLLTQAAQIERDMAEPDAYGAQSTPNWRPLSTVPCRLWWEKSRAGRGAQREYVSPVRTVPFQVAGLILPLNTDVTEKDRIAQVIDRSSGEVLLSGLFEIVTVLAQSTHIELGLQRTRLGG